MTLDIHFSPAVQRQLRRLGVEAVYLFGSYADGVAGMDSDIDLGIVMDHPAVVSQIASTHDLYQSLYEAFSSIVEFSGKELDIVLLQRASLELRAHVVRTGKILYTNNVVKQLDFEEYTIREYADFAPLRRMIDDAVMQRL